MKNLAHRNALPEMADQPLQRNDAVKNTIQTIEFCLEKIGSDLLRVTNKDFIEVVLEKS